MNRLNYVNIFKDQTNIKIVSRNDTGKILDNILISIIIPVYNGAQTVKGLVDKLVNTMDNENLQIILVNDGSKDNSHIICYALSIEYGSIVTYVELAKNFGEHNAVMAGLHYAKGDYIVIMDDDFQNPPEEVPRLVREAIDHDYDIVYTYYKKKEHHWGRNLGSWFNNRVASILLDKPKDLYLSSFKCLNRFTAKEIIKYGGPYPYIDGLALQCTRKIGKIQVQHNKRKDGRSGYTLKKLMHLWLNMFVNFSVNPLRISFVLSLFFNAFGIILGTIVFFERMNNPAMPIGWASLAILVIVFSGVQLFILGLLGEYIGRMFLSNNHTPQFVVREIHQGLHYEYKH
ncbi:MAG: glycosyltransferase family 2 protein [bacterium]